VNKFLLGVVTGIGLGLAAYRAAESDTVKSAVSKIQDKIVDALQMAIDATEPMI
jgi:hypothetical protein